ncbi:MAG: hypothetical protein ACI85O_002504 [Saprospiraceae bacterium]|jgi:hypothetical protein
MRYLTILAVILFASIGTATAQNDAISTYFKKYVDDDRFSTVFISPKMFDLVQTMDIDMDLDDVEAAAIKDVVNNMKSIRILTSDTDGESLYKEAAGIISGGKGYETLMTVREKAGSNVQFMVKDGDKEGVIRELLLLVGGEDSEFVLMSFIGDINLKNIGKLAKAFED